MSEEEIKILKVLINNKDVFYYEDDFNNRIRPLVGKLLDLYNQTKKELNNIKEIEKSHQEENGKLRVELEQEKEKNKEIAIKNRALKEESNACGEQIVSLDNQLKAKEQEIEYLKSQIPSDKDYISKDKIMGLLENEIIDISGFRCIAVEDIQNLLEDK